MVNRFEYGAEEYHHNEPIRGTVAQKLWEKELAALPDYRTQTAAMLTGAVFPIYDKVFHTGDVGNKIVRVKTNDGRNLVGLLVNPDAVTALKQRLGIGTPLKDATPGEIFDMVQGGGSEIELDNGWKLTQSRVHGEQRVELDYGYEPPSEKQMEKFGLFGENINFKQRYFVSTDREAGAAALTKLLERYKAVRDLTEAGGELPPEESGTLRETGPGYGVKSLANELTRAKQEEQEFSPLVDRALESLDEKVQVPIGETPAVLQALGARPLAMTMAAGTIRKDVNALKHGVPVGMLKQLPTALADPLMVFGSSRGGNALVVMTQLEYNGKTLVAAVHLDQRAGAYEINRVASAYGKDDNAAFGRWMEEGRLRYWDKDKSRDWFLTRGLQLPTVYSQSGYGKTILTKADVFKGEVPGDVVKENHGLETDTTDGRLAEGRAAGKTGSVAEGETVAGGKGVQVRGAGGALGGRSEREANAAVANTDPANGKAVNPDVAVWRANPETRQEAIDKLDGVTPTKLLRGKTVNSPESLVAALQPLADLPYEVVHVVVLGPRGDLVSARNSFNFSISAWKIGLSFSFCSSVKPSFSDSSFIRSRKRSPRSPPPAGLVASVADLVLASPSARTTGFKVMAQHTMAAVSRARLMFLMTVFPFGSVSCFL